MNEIEAFCYKWLKIQPEDDDNLIDNLNFLRERKSHYVQKVNELISTLELKVKNVDRELLLEKQKKEEYRLEVSEMHKSNDILKEIYENIEWPQKSLATIKATKIRRRSDQVKYEIGEAKAEMIQLKKKELEMLRIQNALDIQKSTNVEFIRLTKNIDEGSKSITDLENRINQTCNLIKILKKEINRKKTELSKNRLKKTFKKKEVLHTVNRASTLESTLVKKTKELTEIESKLKKMEKQQTRIFFSRKKKEEDLELELKIHEKLLNEVSDTVKKLEADLLSKSVTDKAKETAESSILSNNKELRKIIQNHDVKKQEEERKQREIAEKRAQALKHTKILGLELTKLELNTEISSLKAIIWLFTLFAKSLLFLKKSNQDVQPLIQNIKENFIIPVRDYSNIMFTISKYLGRGKNTRTTAKVSTSIFLQRGKEN